jgi:maltooligosyltrehalose trehalohydrolase
MFGAIPESGGVRFTMFADPQHEVGLQLLTGAGAGMYQTRIGTDGVFEAFVPRAVAGDRYMYTLNGSDPRPDPASRFQPDGVHGPSEVIEPDNYRWRHDHWQVCAPRQLVIYELHVGTFTARGTFAAARERLQDLRDLSITAVELMPIADFAGTRNWGYDGVCLYAPSRNYGHPDDLRAFVDAAHGWGIAVILDLVYNHLGSEGAYLTQFYPDYITDRHSTPWGGAVNLDGPGSGLVRSFIIDNAVHWIREYWLDGLRLDATHALIDNSPTHIIAELVDHVRAAVPWPLVIHAEDHRNLAALIDSRENGGWGLDGVWADDFHHIVRRQLAGDAHGYYEDFTGTSEELARTIHQGWLFTGQHSKHMGGQRGSDPSRIPMQRFVVCLQNHDQVGNRAHGDRLHHNIDPAAWRAASTVLLTAPMTPLLFMGQEWAAGTPFQYFTDLEPEIGRLVSEGRRREFKDFPEFDNPGGDEAIPDPQSPASFEASRLDWTERGESVHRATLALYKELLRLRSTHRALAAAADVAGDAIALDGGLIMRRTGDGEQFQVIARLSRGGPVTLVSAEAETWTPEIVFSTEDVRFTGDPAPPEVNVKPASVTILFQRPGAIVVRLPFSFSVLP